MSYLFPTYSRMDLEITEGKGTIVKDAKGNSYLDFVAGIGVCSLGHCPTEVRQAVQKQLHNLWHASNLFFSPLQEQTAKLLADQTGGGAVFFCNSGTEANEAALKLARKHTGRTKIISFEQSFHGRTFGSMAATGQQKIQAGYGPMLEEFVHVPFNNLEAMRKVMDENTAAVMLEAVQGEGGVHPGDEDFIRGAEELCREYGALLIVDEVQTGIGRTGRAFAYQHFGVSPDIITVAKGMAGGLPAGAIIGKPYLVPSFSAGAHASTFGGNPVVMSAASAVLEQVFQDAFLAEIREKGEQFKVRLNQLLDDVPICKEVRGMGLMLGIEFDREVSPLVEALKEKGLLTLTAGPTVLRLLPPLTVSQEELEQAANIIGQTARELAEDHASV